MKQQIVYRYRILPTLDQKIQIHKTIGCARLMYNMILEDRKICYNELGISILPRPTDYKKDPDYSFLKEVDSLALCNAQLNIETAFKKFFKGESNFPKFKSKYRGKQTYTTNVVNKNITIHHNSIVLPKVPGYVRMKKHRNIPKNYVLKNVTVIREPDDTYYAACCFEYKISEIKQHSELKNSIGLDYSSPNFYIDSNGFSPKKPKFFVKSEEALTKEQRKLSRMEKNSNNYKKQQKKINKLYARIKRQRKDWIEKLSTNLANTYDIVCVEDINLRNISQSLKLGKSTMDNGFGMFRSRLEHKLVSRGKRLIKVDKFYPSTKTCSHCGEKQVLKLADRSFVCKNCGAIVDRDINAAINIRNQGINQFYTNRWNSGDSLFMLSPLGLSSKKSFMMQNIINEKPLSL